MLADDSSVDGSMIRVRTRARRPKERPKERAYPRASCRHEGEQWIPAPPGLEGAGGEELTERSEEDDAWDGALTEAAEARCPSLNAIAAGRETEESKHEETERALRKRECNKRKRKLRTWTRNMRKGHRRKGR
jgi:hypothetical protein